MGKNPLVSICSITYNHAPYIRECLDGFLMQKTTFPFEIIIHDDCSTDGTDEIIREYAKKYPDIIKPIFEIENQYSKGVRGMFTKYCYPQAKGKYIALCEGDDYWTDPLKLQRQVDFLESHPDYSLCFHNAKTKMLDGQFQDNIYAISGTREYSADEIIRNWTIPTASAVYRLEIENDGIANNPKFKFSDNIKFLTAAKHGKLYGFDEFWSVYRRNEGGMTVRDGNLKWAKILIEHYKAIEETFGFMLRKNLCKEYISDKYVYLIRRSKNDIGALLNNVLYGIIDGRWPFIKKAFNTWILRRK